MRYIYIFYFLGQDMFDQRLLQGCPKTVDGKLVKLFPSNKWTAGVADVNPLGTCLTSHSQQWFGSTVSVWFFSGLGLFLESPGIVSGPKSYIFSLSVFKNFLYGIKPLFILKICE